MMKKLSLIIALSTCTSLNYANDSTGYVYTGSVEYIQNQHIAMKSEDLYISKHKIKVAYDFENLSNQSITENILFPLPAIDNIYDSDFADTNEYLNHFKIKANGKQIQPIIHVRAFMYDPKHKDADGEYKKVDVTAQMKACGISDAELQSPWTKKIDIRQINQKIANCHNPIFEKFDHFDTEYHSYRWASQIIYSWQQTFAPQSITKIYHEYQPLVGYSYILINSQEDAQQFCIDHNLKKALQNKIKSAQNYNIASYQLGYILTTGANWAKPIENFKLTIERDPKEFVSLCWAGKLNKVSATRFVGIEKNFTPKTDLNIAFIHVDTFD